MEVLPILNLPSTYEKVEQAAVKLGDVVRNQPHFQAYMQSILDRQSDPLVEELSVQIQKTRNAMYGSKQPEQAGELRRLELRLEDQPAIKAYRAAEVQARDVIRAVNALLSGSLNVDFAANAKRGCGCGG